MAEKVIHEVRFIETEDGFRIEVKGDKERIRKMGCGPGIGMGFGPGRHFWRRKWGRGKRGPWKHGPGYGPWNWWFWPEEEPEEHEGFEEPPKEA